MKLALLFALASTALAEGPGGYGVSVLTEDGCYTATGPGHSAIALGRGWNNGNLEQPVTVYYTSHESTPEAQAIIDNDVIPTLRRLLPLVTLEKTTDVTAKFTVRIQSAVLGSNILGIGTYPYSVEPVAGDVTVQSSLTGNKLLHVLLHEAAHGFGIPHGGMLMLPYYQEGVWRYETPDQLLWSLYYRINPIRYMSPRER